MYRLESFHNLQLTGVVCTLVFDLLEGKSSQALGNSSPSLVVVVMIRFEKVLSGLLRSF